MTAPPPRSRIFEVARKVASVDVAPAPPPGSPAASPPATGTPTSPSQGTVVILRDRLMPEDLVPTPLPVAATPRNAAAPAVVAPPAIVAEPHRYYVAIALDARGRPGPPGPLVELPLLPLPDPPGPPAFTYTQDAVTLSWEPSGGIVGFLLENALLPEPAPVDEAPAAPASRAAAPVTVPAGPLLYNVYRELAPDPNAPAGAPAAPWDAVPPAPINIAPAAALTLTDADQMELGRQRCYTVRAVRGVAPNVIVSEPSERACLTPEDRFAPLAPTGLSAIAGEGSISLIWEPNGEADLGGYVVLRGQAGDATLQRLTDTPLTDTRFVDRSVMPGVRYVYAVQAVDTHQPEPNVSEESNRVEETAR
jgi:hypothetical protein